MNRIIRIIAIFILNIIDSAPCSAQTNSVQLQDGLGNLISSHASIQEAYNAIPATLTQAYEIELQPSYSGTSESYPIIFVNKAGADALNTISVTVSPALTNIININYGPDTSSIFIFDDADWMIIDFATSGGGFGIAYSSTGIQVDFPTVQLINGACHNIFRKTRFSAGYWVGQTPAVLFGGSPSNASGNSDNLIENCRIENNTIAFVSDGTPANPNRNNRIYSSVISALNTTIWLRNGNGRIDIDSNDIDRVTANPNDYNGILMENQSDSVFITKNKIGAYIGLLGVPTRCIYSSTTLGTSAYTYIANNYIYILPYANYTDVNYDSTELISGIEFEGSSPIQADMYNNTVRVRGKYASGSNNIGYSTCFKKQNSVAGSVFNIENNIFSTERYGGTNSEHIALWLNNTAGTLNINNNTYNSGGDPVKYNNVLYSTFPAYQSAIGGGNETNSNLAPVEFFSPLDHRLYGISVNNPALYGTFVPGIDDDIDGDARVSPYRGCDEYEVNCLPVTSIATNLYSNTPNICPGDSFVLVRSPQSFGNGRVYQWQSRPAGTTVNFTDIPGATHHIFTTAAYQSTEYRTVDSCVTGGLVIISNAQTAIIQSLPTVSGIAETHSAFTYNFTGNGLSFTTNYLWDFGDGTQATTLAPQHTFADTGVYTITFIVSNSCGSDTATLTIHITMLSVSALDNEHSISLYPNPAKNELHVLSPGSTIKETMIYSITGALVSSQNSATKDVKINTSSLPTGLYILCIKTDNGTEYKQLQVLK